MSGVFSRSMTLARLYKIAGLSMPGWGWFCGLVCMFRDPVWLVWLKVYTVGGL